MLGIRASGAAQIYLQHLLVPAGKLHLQQPAKRARHPALVTRLQQLQHQHDEQRYEEMVKDIVHTGGKKDDDWAVAAQLKSARLQISFMTHVLVTMGTFFLAGLYAARSAEAGDAVVSAAAPGFRVRVAHVRTEHV